MRKHNRIIPIIVLLCLICSFFLFPAPALNQLEDLELLIAKPDVSPIVWLNYATKLQELERYPSAAQAYTKYLENDPYSRVANMGKAYCLCISDEEGFLVFAKGLLVIDPKLTLDILDRPEAQKFMNDGRFLELRKEASAQAMD
jgi:hypothetical protein